MITRKLWAVIISKANSSPRNVVDRQSRMQQPPKRLSMKIMIRWKTFDITRLMLSMLAWGKNQSSRFKRHIMRSLSSDGQTTSSKQGMWALWRSNRQWSLSKRSMVSIMTTCSLSLTLVCSASTRSSVKRYAPSRSSTRQSRQTYSCRPISRSWMPLHSWHMRTTSSSARILWISPIVCSRKHDSSSRRLTVNGIQTMTVTWVWLFAISAWHSW